MARDAELWARIREDFLASGLSYSELAKKYGVSLSAVKRAGTKGKWMAQRSAIDAVALATPNEANRTRAKRTSEPGKSEPPDEETEALIIDLKRERLEKFMAVTDGMMDRIQDAIQSPEVLSPYALKLLASALRDLREMQGLNRSELDIEEQRARIAKLKMDTESATVSEGGSLIVEFIDLDGAEN